MEATTNQTELTRKPFRFTGEAGEYFRIWGVNILLSIITLGIYSAWAKVRQERYFYANTFLDDTPFEYHANPVAILKGRLVAAVVIGVYIASVHFWPDTEPLFNVAFLVVLPWLSVRALAFRARNSSYRNVRFNFDGVYSTAARVFIGWGILTGLSLGLLYPVFVARRNEMMVTNSLYGWYRFSFERRVWRYYLIYAAAVALFLVVVVPGFVFNGVIAANLATQQEAAQALPAGFVAFINLVFLAIFGTAYLLVSAFVKANVTNLMFGQSRWRADRFESRLEAGRMFGLYFSNALAIIFSLGLLIPWAQIRLARYRAERLTLCAADDLDDVVAAQQENVGAAGEELGDALDLDFAL